MKTPSILLLLLLSMLTISLEVPVMARTPQAELSQIQSTNILVTHVKGGNLFLYRQPTTIHHLSPGSITGGVGVPSTNLKPPLINHANYWSPAWIYKIDSLQPQQVISLSIEGSGVRVEIIHPNCIALQKPSGFLAVGPSGCRTWSSTSNEDFNAKETYVHLKADSSAMPGQRKLSVKYKTTIGLKKQTWEFTRTFTVYVARSGKAQLINAAYSTSIFISGKPVIDYGSLQPDDAIANVIQESEERLRDVLNNIIKNNEGASSSSTESPYQREVIPINELKSGTPIIGQMLPPALRAPVLELTFSGSEVATLKFAAPNCLLASTKIVDAQKNSLRILATFRVPAHASLPGSRMVSRLSDIPSIPCHWFLYDPILDSVLSQQASHEGNGLYNFTFLNPEQTVINIRPQFLTIAGMGDSYAAGEGAPDRFNPVTKVATWEMEQCHRSKNSRFTQGTQKLTEIPGVWILYQNFACSGASINEGILGRYVGIPRPFGSVQPLPLDSQLNQVKRWLNEQGIAELDALILGIGGNDTGFGQIVADCASPLVSNCIVHPPLQQSVFRGEPGSTAVIGFQNLPAMYDVLAQALKGISRQIFITDYPDPTRWGGRPDGTSSEWCTLSTDDEDYGILPSDLFWGDINAEHPLARYLKVGAKASNLEQSEVAWMYNDVLRRLNNEVRAAAQRHEWRLISGFVEHSYDRGFCLRKRFINTFRDSIEDIQGDVFGSVHPNKEAYHLYGEIIARDLALFFRLPDRPNIMVVDEVHPEDPRGPGFQPPVLNSVITGRQRFEIQIAPTTRSLNVMFEIVRRNRFSGNLIQGEQQIQAYRVPGYQSRLQYFVEWDLNPCERLEYRWRIQHSGTGGVKTTATNRRSIIPDAQANELNSCPK